MIIEYEPRYDEQVKDLLLELQEYIVNIDKEKYHIIGKDFRESYFQKTMEEVQEKSGKIFLYQDQNRIVGLIIGVVNNEEEKSDEFQAPKRGRITELIVAKDFRGKHIGQELLEKMKQYLKANRM